ncbi:MAG: sodium:solute symporter family protein [Bacteroidetes bacterium]|nr:MAG: sodium:solute symporter family protein [Bacteroidota bacterium]
MTFHWLDILVIIIYFLLILFVGFYLTNKKKSKSAYSDIDFILAGRGLTLPFFVATLVATWYGNIFGIGEFVYTGGLVAWVCFGLPYYITAFLFAIFIAKKIRKSDVKTIPEHMEIKYGKKAGFISSVIVIIITLPAQYILMVGLIFQLFTGWSLWICVICSAILSLAYLYTGGFRADVLTNTAQFVIMYIGFGVLLVYTILTYGSPFQVFGKLPAYHLSFSGGLSWQVILSWFIISFQTFVDPGFHQRCSAATSAKTAQRGILVSIGFWVLFDTLTLLTGLYSRAVFPNINPLNAYTTLANTVLPVFWKGFFVTALLAVVMSTLDSYAFITAVTIGNDILKKIKLKFREQDSTKSLIRIGLIITAILSVALAIILPSALQLLYKTSSIAIPGLLIPLTISFFKRYHLSRNGAIIIMLVSSGISLIWTIGRVFTGKITILGKLFWEIEPMLAGISISLVLSVLLISKIKSNEQK